MKHKVNLDDVLNEWRVRDEEELEHELLDDWESSNCCYCGKKISLINCSWSSIGKPVCRGGCR
jgi:hypothetical protein